MANVLSSPTSPATRSMVSPDSTWVGPTLPVRIFGPQRSCRIATGLPSFSLSARMVSARRPCSSQVPCEKLRRATSMPASIKLRIPVADSAAGPMVQTIFTRRTAMLRPACHRHGPRGKEAIMFGFHRDAAGRARFGSALVADLMAEAGVQTPAYVYDLSAIRAEVQELVAAFGATPHLGAYAGKANPAGRAVRTARGAGGGADVVSGGGLRVALGAGVLPEDTVMSGVGKADWELDLAIATGIYAIQVESVSEVARVASRARALSRQARVSLRV